MSEKRYFIIDFDSTFTKVEALEELAEICLQGLNDKEERIEKIRDLTQKAMNGDISFKTSLEERLKLLKAKKSDLDLLTARLEALVSESFHRNKAFFNACGDEIMIVSSGFREFIVPIVRKYNIHERNVFANSFIFDEEGNIAGFDTSNPLSEDGGKVKLMKVLALNGEVIVIGDGYTDYEIRKAGLADKFVAFTENVAREKVLHNADLAVKNLDEFLFENNLPRALSYPKSRIKVLLLENIHPKAAEIFLSEGYQVEMVKSALSEEELCNRIKDVSILGIRSKTILTAKVLQAANRLICAGAFCIGTNQIDLNAALTRGVCVFNAPYSNTRSVVELAVGHIIALFRNIPRKNAQMHAGIWDKSATGSREIRGKKLGIVGYGSIGSQLSVLAEAMGMEVYFYDVVDKLALGNAKICRSLEELLRKVDVLSLHTDGRKENQNLIGKKELQMMQKGSFLVNLARGHVVDIDALCEALSSGHIAGAAIDVFPYEPAANDEPFVSPLTKFDNVILTPHIGGSTAEAQENIAEYVPAKIIDYINSGSTYASVNFPNLQLPRLLDAHRLIHLHHNVPGILAKINGTLAEFNVNIVGQYLKTNDKVGYVITDVNRAYEGEVTAALKAIPDTIRFRILY
jgi:D-3-phosphoglycerate dehydrogenase